MTLEVLVQAQDTIHVYYRNYSPYQCTFIRFYVWSFTYFKPLYAILPEVTLKVTLRSPGSQITIKISPKTPKIEQMETASKSRRVVSLSSALSLQSFKQLPTPTPYANCNKSYSHHIVCFSMGQTTDPSPSTTWGPRQRAPARKRACLTSTTTHPHDSVSTEPATTHHSPTCGHQRDVRLSHPRSRARYSCVKIFGVECVRLISLLWKRVISDGMKLDWLSLCSSLL